MLSCCLLDGSPSACNVAVKADSEEEDDEDEDADWLGPSCLTSVSSVLPSIDSKERRVSLASFLACALFCDELALPLLDWLACFTA